MTVCRLRFPDEATAINVLSTYRQDDAWAAYTHDYALDVIGPVAVSQAVIDTETGEVITPAVVDERFHVNLLVFNGNYPPGIGPYIVTPAHPVQDFA